jgi:ketosteroid isomerase-like protein
VTDDHVEKLKRAYAAFSRGDFEGALTHAHPDIEYIPADGAAQVRGVDAFGAWMEPDAFEWQVIEPIDFVVAGSKVLVRHRIRSKGAGSGIELEAFSWGVWTIDEDGLATRIQGFSDGDERAAREAAGLGPADPGRKPRR